MESVAFLISILVLLIYITVPLGIVGGVIYFFNQRQKEKRVEATKDYSKY